jgi:hypothetical protein
MGLRQPGTSSSMRYLIDQGWVISREKSKMGKVHQEKIYMLTKPVHEIIEFIAKEKENEATHNLALLQKLRKNFRSYISLTMRFSWQIMRAGIPYPSLLIFSRILSLFITASTCDGCILRTFSNFETASKFRPSLS